jgi:hypothetical protein
MHADMPILLVVATLTSLLSVVAYAHQGTATFYNPPYLREYIYIYIDPFSLLQTKLV